MNWMTWSRSSDIIISDTLHIVYVINKQVFIKLTFKNKFNMYVRSGSNPERADTKKSYINIYKSQQKTWSS